MQIKMKVDGTDRASSIPESSVVISNVINKRIDTCKFSLHDTTGSISIAELQEVIFSNQAETTRYFAGYITDIRYRTIGGVQKAWDISCQDYTVLLDRTLVNEKYEGRTTAYILNDAFTTYLPEIDASTYVATGITYDWLLVNRMTLRQLVDKLARENNMDWYIDYNKNLHFFTQETNLAPFGISDTPDDSTTYAAERMKYAKKAATIKNRYTVIGGYYLSGDVTWAAIPASGDQKEIRLPYVLEPADGDSKISVWVNDNNDAAPNWVVQTVGWDNIDVNGVGGITVLLNRDEKTLIFNTAPLKLDLAVKVTARYHIPTLVKVRSDASYVKYGRWFDGKIVDKNLISRDQAKLAGKAELAKTAFAKEVGSYVLTDRDGMVAGQRQNIGHPKFGINGDYLITRVTTRILGGAICQYQVSFGEYNPDLVDILLGLKRDDHEEVREDEVLIELFEQIETLILSEVTDYHIDLWDGETSRWIADYANQGIQYHVQHERVMLAEAVSDTEEITERYKWQ